MGQLTLIILQDSYQALIKQHNLTLFTPLKLDVFIFHLHSFHPAHNTILVHVPATDITVARYNTFQTNLGNEKVCLAVTKGIVGWEGHGGVLIIQQLENVQLLFGSNKMFSYTTVSLYTGVHI